MYQNSQQLLVACSNIVRTKCDWFCFSWAEKLSNRNRIIPSFNSKLNTALHVKSMYKE